MQSQALYGDWDFVPAIKFIRSQSVRHTLRFQRQPVGEISLSGSVKIEHNAETGDQAVSEPSLGKFDTLFSTLGIRTDSHPRASWLADAEANANSRSVELMTEHSIYGQYFKERRVSRLSRSRSGEVLSLESTYSETNKATVGRKLSDHHVNGSKRVWELDKETEVLSGSGPGHDESHIRRAIIQKIVGNSNPKDKDQWHQIHQKLAPASIGPLRDSEYTSHRQNLQISRSDSQNKVPLIILLRKRFPRDRCYLSNIVPGFGNSSPRVGWGGTHIFVDISNILIGFHDAIKRSNGLSKGDRIPRERLSFYNLSLILERGRPFSKRVIVGSDNIESTQEAQALGYETNILERVVKARESRRVRHPSSFGISSSSEEVKPVRLRSVEQGVDEILHLKMLESLLDAEEPSTMVLATGDAAEAEYSGGFLRMVERALSRQWKVELVSFRENMSWAYKNPQWISKWAPSFTIIELDDYVESLRFSLG